MSRMSAEISQYVNAGWSWVGPVEVEGYFELRARELPDFFLADASREGLLSQVNDALRAYFEAIVQSGHQLPALPQNWVRVYRAPRLQARVTTPQPENRGATTDKLQLA
jgi:hypothetical protein